MAVAASRLSTLACLGLLWLGCATTAATGLRTSPSWLVLGAGQKSAELSVSNTGDQPLHAQVRLYRWTQHQGKEQLTPTRDMAVSPPIMEIAPRQRQVVRLVRLGETASPQEGSYRILIDQLPRPGVTGEQTVLRYSAPVFVAPAAPGAPRLSTSLSHEDRRTLLRVDNHGSTHARLADLGYRDADGRRVTVADRLAGYVLPGQYKTWDLPERAGGYADGEFVAKVNQDRTERPLPPAQAR
jgi:fimbrial chaperone protein